MKKSVSKKFIAWLLTCVAVIPMFTFFCLSAQAAEEEITPYYNNVITADSAVTVSENGLMLISNKYTGIQGITTTAVITTYIEKKVLGLFWSRVDIGNPDKQWVNIINYYQYVGNHTFQLPSTGTYRVTVTYRITGSGGSADEIKKEITCKY